MGSTLTPSSPNPTFGFMPSSRYFGGPATNLGQVSGFPVEDFAGLVTALKNFKRLPLTRSAFHTLPATERARLKRNDYVTAATFKADGSRRTEFAVSCNLIALDIDDASQAKQMLSQPWEEILPTHPLIVWHTVSSTTEAPRLRILVAADSIPISRYAEAVRTVGEAFGLSSITSESLVPVQPMFLPVVFEDQQDSPIAYERLEGEPFTHEHITTTRGPAAPAGEEGVDTDLAHLRLPIDNLTLEDARDVLRKLDPDCSMREWVEVGMGLKHQFGAEGYVIWDDWSSKGGKYGGEDETQARWNSFKPHPTNRAPVTMRTLIHRATLRGWNNPALTRRMYDQIAAFIRSSVSTEKLLDEVPRMIARATPLIGDLEKKSLLHTMKSVCAERQFPISLTDLRDAVRKVELDAAKGGVANWARNFCYVTSTNHFFQYDTGRKFSPEVLDLAYQTSTNADVHALRARDYLITVANVPQVEATRYEPAHENRQFYTDNGVPYLNIYRATYPKADDSRADEAGEVFMEHLHNLVAERQYREWLIDWLCYPVVNPGKKIRWSVLLQGAQGCGKTFLACAVAAVLGQENVRKLAASDVFDRYNGWAFGSQLVFLEEVRVVGHNRFAVMDRLKPCISDDQISVREMFEPPRTVPNITNYMMFTNHHDALAVTDEDRRYFVLKSRIQHREQVAELGDEYFDRIFGMLEHNAGGLRAWMLKRKFTDGFKPNGRAPMTSYLTELATTAASPLAAAVEQAIQDNAHPLVAPDLLSLQVLRTLLGEMNVGVFSDQALGLVLMEHGWRRADRIRLGDSRHTMWTKKFKGDIAHAANSRLEVI